MEVPLAVLVVFSVYIADVITIIQMFPEFLPEKLRKNSAAFDLPANDKKRALLALGNYLSAVWFLYIFHVVYIIFSSNSSLLRNWRLRNQTDRLPNQNEHLSDWTRDFEKIIIMFWPRKYSMNFFEIF